MGGFARKTGRLLVLALASAALACPSAWAARSWQPPIELSAPGADAWVGKPVPALSVLPTGEAIVAWREGGEDGWTVKAAEKPRGGSLIGPQVLGGGADPPSVATAADGSGYVAWVGSTSPGEGDTVLVAERTAAGGFGAPIELAGGAMGSLQPGTALAANERGEAIVMFTTGTWNDQRVWAARRTHDGAWHAPQPVTGELGEAIWRGHAGMAENGEVVLSWLSWDPGAGNSAWTAILPPSGPATHVKRMQAARNRSTLPSLAVDRLGNAIVSWVELPPDDTVFVGEVRAAVRAPGHAFGDAIDLGGSTTDFDPAVVGLGDDGVAVVGWQSAVPNGPNGASLSGLVAATGVVPAGTFAPPEQVSSSWLVDTPLSMAVDPLGNSIFFFPDWDTGEARVVRRSAIGLNGQERAILPCPRQRAYPIASAVDPAGNASVLWNESRFHKSWQGLRLSQDVASSTFSPDPCPAPPPPLTWSPKDPAPGDEVAFDGSGFVDPDAARTTFKWDFDGDGTFEVDTGETPRASHTFPTAGEHGFRVQVAQESQKPGNGVTFTCHYTIRVGSPPEPPNEYPAYPADPRPSDLPDEDPWPIGDKPKPPPLPPLPELPPLPTGLPPGLLDQPPAPAPLRPASTGILLLGAPETVSPRSLLAGVQVSVASARTARVRLRLIASGAAVRAAGSRVLAGPASVRVRKGRVVLVRLRLGRAGRRAVRSGKLRKLTLEAVPRGGRAARHRIRVR
ncbi:MAG TPA: PKD domain-containing protein [Thermoleophilaceae bacterium]